MDYLAHFDKEDNHDDVDGLSREDKKVLSVLVRKASFLSRNYYPDIKNAWRE